jgi:predicted phosphate transport protein (TIGR00153 family)
MLRWFQALMPREDKFFDMFVRHADTITRGAVALRGVLQGGEGAAAHAAEVSRQEQIADDIFREVLLAVRRTFITPFDRSDISGLSSALDDAIDQMQRTTKKIDLFDVRNFEPMMVQMGDVIVEASELAARMVALLPDVRGAGARIAALNVQMTKLEDKADQLHDQGVKALYLAHRTADPMAFVVGTEVYDHLEKVVDRLEDIANRISDIVVENM